MLQRTLKYPKKARKAGIEAVVPVTFVVTEQGEISDISAIDVQGYGFDKAAIKAVKRKTWIPAQHQGQQIPVVHTMMVIFRLNN